MASSGQPSINAPKRHTSAPRPLALPSREGRRAGRVRFGERTSHPRSSLGPKAADPSSSSAPKPRQLAEHRIPLSQGDEQGVDGNPVGTSQSL